MCLRKVGTLYHGSYYCTDFDLGKEGWLFKVSTSLGWTLSLARNGLVPICLGGRGQSNYFTSVSANLRRYSHTYIKRSSSHEILPRSLDLQDNDSD